MLLATQIGDSCSGPEIVRNYGGSPDGVVAQQDWETTGDDKQRYLDYELWW